MTILSRPALKARRTFTDPVRALARALQAATARLAALIPRYKAPREESARRRFVETTWNPADRAVSRAEDRLLQEMRRRGVAGVVVGDRLFLDIDACTNVEVNFYRSCAVGSVPVALLPDLTPRRPAAADWPDWTDKQHVSLV